MKRRLATIALVALTWCGFVAARGVGGDPLNTGMADPAALVSAYDRFAADRHQRMRWSCRSPISAA